MTIKNKEIKGYFREIRKCIPGDRKVQKKITEDIRQAVENYLEENPDTDWASLQAHFGTPHQITEAYIADMEADEIMNKLSTKKRIIRIIAITAIVAILIWAICLAITVIKDRKSADGYFEVEIIEVTEETK